MTKVTNIHISLLQIIKHLNSEINHYNHLASTYPNDPRFENNIKTINFLQGILNYITAKDDTAVSEKAYDFIISKYKELVEMKMWKEKTSPEKGFGAPLIVQTVQPLIPEVEKVEEVELPKVKAKSKSKAKH